MKLLKSSLIILAAVFMPLRGEARLNKLPVDPAVRIGTLENGLTYYIRQNSKPAGRADFFIAQRVGSVNEEENQRGLAHFLEHMCFNGTRHFPGNTLISYLESIGVKFGANLNAYTSTDETVYNICDVPTVRQSSVDSCLLILRDWSHDLTLNDSDIEAERGVIKGEWRQRQGTAMNRMMEKALPILYTGSLYGQRMPIGLMEIVENCPGDAIRAYYRKWYHPENQCIVVTGDINPDSIEAQIRHLWSDVDRPVHNCTPPKIDVPDNKKTIASVQSDPEQVVPMVQIYLKHGGVAPENENTIAELRHDLIRDLVSSMLAERLDDAEHSSGTLMSNVAIGDMKYLVSRTRQAMMVRATTSPGREAECVGAIARVLRQAAIHGFTPVELQRAKLDRRARLDREFAGRGNVTNTQYARTYVRHYLDGGALPSTEQYYRMMKGVLANTGLEDINRYIAEVVTPDGSNAVIASYLPAANTLSLTPQHLVEAYCGVDEASLEPYRPAQLPDLLLEREPAAGTIVAETTDTVMGDTTWRLSNGIKVHVRKTGFTPGQVLIAAYSPGGFSAGYNPALAADYRLCNDVLAISGFGGHTSTELRRMTAGRKARVDVTIDNMEERLSASTSREDMSVAMQLLYLKATSPQRDDTAFKTLLDNNRLKLTSQTTNPTFTMADSIHYHVYGRHPLGEKLKAADLDSVSYDRILALHAERFGDMSDFDFYIVGDFDVDSLRDLTCRYIASLPGNGRMETRHDIGYRYTTGRNHLRFTTPMETPQTIAYTFFNSPCDYTLRDVVCGHILGSLMQSALLAELRENRGWTYGVKAHGGVSAGMNGNDSPRYIMPVYIRVAPENASETFEIVDRTAERFSDASNIRPEELSKVKQYMLKSHEQNLTDNTYWLTVMHMRDKFGRDMHSSYRETVESLTRDDIAAFCNTHLCAGHRIRLEMSPQEQ